MKRLVKNLSPGFISVLAAISVSAQTTNTFDEFGNGIIQSSGGSQTLTYLVGADPTSGLNGANVLIYSLPYVGVSGDVLIFTGDPQSTPLDDVIRFDGNSHLIFYADNIDGHPAGDIADTLGPPNPLLGVQFNISEINNGLMADYTPTALQPGYNALNPSYVFLIDVPVPEPRSTMLLLAGLGVLALARLRRGWRSRVGSVNKGK
jgi:hypothetical protein